MRTILVDGDNVAWLCAREGDDSVKSQDNALRHVAKQAQVLRADRIIVCFSDESRRYFRHDLCPEYKAKRKERPPEWYDVAEALKNNHPHRSLNKLEADDVIGILATHPTVQGEKIIVGRDSDLQQIPAWHYDTRAHIAEFKVDAMAADYNFYHRILVGKTGDGIDGCPGVGQVKANQVMMQAKPILKALAKTSPCITPDCWQSVYWRCVLDAFDRAGRTRDDAVRQANLVRILRADDVILPFNVNAPVVIKGWLPPDEKPRGGAA
jgi:DNA polymerase-1